VEFPTDLNLSEEFKDFVLRILNRDPKVRLCSDELLKHKFIEKYSEFETC
jgi:serine/threonine protein kinase